MIRARCEPLRLIGGSEAVMRRIFNRCSIPVHSSKAIAVTRWEEAILEAVKLAPASVQEVIRGLQALRGIAHISAVTIALG